MKKLFLFAVAAVALTAACSKQAPDVASNVSRGSDFELEPPVPVQFASNLAHVATKSIGALDYWSAEDLYFYGIERFKDQSGRDSLDLDNLFIANVKETAPNTTDPLHPVTVGTITLNRALPGGGSEPYYYGNGNYEFFGYFVDDAAGTDPTPTIDFSDSTIILPVKIDGTQDLMVGYADRDSVIKYEYERISELPMYTDTEGPSEDAVKSRLFSAYAIRKWTVQPKMYFHHKLTRFDFYVQSGESDAAGVIKVAGISVNSNTEADMVVAGQHIYDGLRNIAAPEDLVLNVKAPDGSLTPLVPLTVDNEIPAPAYDAANPVRTKIDGSLLVMPGQSIYDLTLSLHQDDAQEPSSRPEKTQINFAKLLGGTHTQAMPGYKYNITLVVYKFREVEITVSIDEWKEGGDIVLDPDAE